MSKEYFSEEWEEIHATAWQWVMWDNENEEVVGWVIDITEEEFSDKNTGEVRKNPVCYMATDNGKYVRFIIPTDLKNKLETISDKRVKANFDWKDIILKIVYLGKVETSKGYKVKTFKVFAKKSHIPEEIVNDIPELPNNFDVIDDNF